MIEDHEWLEGDFLKTVQQRGAAIIKARGASSAASAANAVVDTVASMINQPLNGRLAQRCLCSDGSYGVEEGLIQLLSCAKPDCHLEIVQGLEIDSFSRGKIDATVGELLEEKAMVAESDLENPDGIRRSREFQLAVHLDYTLLKPDAPLEEIKLRCQHAAQLGLHGVSVHSSRGCQPDPPRL